MSYSRKGFFVLILVIVVGLPVQAVSPARADSFSAKGAIELTLETGAFTLQQAADGHGLVQIEGFAQAGEPGQPSLPQRVYFVAVPPDVDAATVQLEVTGFEQETVPGYHSLAQATADLTSGLVPAQASRISKPGSVSHEPAASVSLSSPGQLRKWRFVRLVFSPVLFWPDSGRLDVVTSVTLRLTYDMTIGGQDESALADTLADDQAGELFLNYGEAAAWYTLIGAEDSTSAGYNYVIVTTNAVVKNSANLTKFKFRKDSMGFTTKIVTESDYGGLTGQAPNGTAEKIRQWLIANYADNGIKYVLLVGDPNPATGDVPMKMCHPMLGGTYPESPTDYFYADLTGNWDLNGDGYFGVYGSDTGSGGVDYAAEVSVGRIPVYNDNTTVLDAILQKIMDYEDEIGPVSWRSSALLPMSFSTTTYDGAPLAQQMKADYLTSAGYDLWTQYQQGSGACGLNSTYSSNQELRGGTTVRTKWAANDYGLVVWWGHGSNLVAAVGCDGCWDGNILSSSDVSYLDDDHPAFVFQNSCLNGYPEYSTNLGFSLLKQGAIGTVSASRVSWFNTGVGYGSFDGSTTNSGIAYEYSKRIVTGQAGGDALYNAKGSMRPESSTRLMNLFDFNLYGDPSVGVLSYVSSSKAPRPPNNLKLTQLSGDELQITWQDNSPNETGFFLETSTDGVNWELLSTEGADVVSATDSQAASNAPFYRVAAYNGHGTSDYAGPVSLFWTYVPVIVRQAE